MHFTFDRLFILICVLSALGGLLWISLVSLMAWAILRPPRMSAGKAIYHLRRLSPGDLGLAFEEENFTVRDKRSISSLHISGWWIPAEKTSNRCVILIHGYADAKVGAVAWAPLLHSMGLNILAIDLRAHGDSGGRFSTGGYFEREDTTQVIDQILIFRPDQTRQLTLFGVSLGAAVAVAVGAQRTDISAMILESPFADYERAIAAHSRLLGLPGGAILKTAIALAQKISGGSFKQVRPEVLLGLVKCPVLTIVGSDDELLEEMDLMHLQSATQTILNSQFWRVEGSGHLTAMMDNLEEYEKRLGEFLASAIQP